MAGPNLTQVSILNAGFSTVPRSMNAQAGTFGNVSFLNPPQVFAAGSNVTFSTSGNSVTINAAAGGTGGGAAQSFSAGTRSGAANPVVFSNSNGVSFGFSGSTITASHNGLTTTAQAFKTLSAGTASFTGDILHVGIFTTTTPFDGLYVQAVAGSLLIGNSSGFRRISAGATYVETTNLSLANSNGISFGIAGATVTASHNGLTTTPTLNQVQDPTTDKVFNMGLNALQFQYAGGGTFSTNATRQGLFEIDVVGALTDGADVLHIHQSVGNPVIDLLHLEAAGTGVTPLHIVAGGATGMEINAPIHFGGGSVPMVLGTSQSNVVSNLNAFYLEGTRGSDYAARTHTHGSGPSLTGPVAATSNSAAWSLNVNAIGNTTAQTNVTWTVGTNGLSLNAAGYAGTGTSATNASITLNSNGLAINVAAPGAGPSIAGYWAVPPWGYGSESNALLTNITGISRRFMFYPFQVANNLSFGEIHWPMSRAATGANSFSVFLAIYSYSNSTRLDSLWSTSVGYSNSDTASVSGLRGFEATWASTSLSPGQYVLGMMFDPVGGSTSAMNYSLMGAATGNPMLQTQVVNGANTYHTNVNHMWLPFHGRYSVTSAAVPASVPSVSILAQGSTSNQPLPMFWVLGNHYT